MRLAQLIESGQATKLFALVIHTSLGFHTENVCVICSPREQDLRSRASSHLCFCTHLGSYKDLLQHFIQGGKWIRGYDQLSD